MSETERKESVLQTQAAVAATPAVLSVQYGPIEAAPEAVGYEAERLERLDAHFGKLISDGRLQGASYLLGRDGAVFAHRAMGRRSFRDDSSAATLRTDSIRRVFSITKWMTAVAIMQLVEQGKLLLHDAVAAVIPEFNTPLHNRITAFHLLTHTSGLPADPGSMTEPYPRYGVLDNDERNWIKAVLAGPLQAEPGTEWLYSSDGFAVLGEMISRISGMPYEQYVIERIAKPLGMIDTHFDVPADKRDRVCVVSEWQERQVTDAQREPGDAPRSGGGIYSTLQDLYRLGSMMLRGGELDGVRVLGRKSVEAMTRNQLRGIVNPCWGGHADNFPYGLGLGLQDEQPYSPGTYSHEGYGHCAMFVDPKERFIAVYMVPNPEGYFIEAVVSPRQLMWSGLRSIEMNNRREGLAR